jgi:hypothetical protein
MRINQNTGFSTPDRVAVKIRNADTVTIPPGSPIVLAMNGTQDGIAVVLPSTSGAANLIQGLRYGVSTISIPVNGYGEAIVFGLAQTLLLERQTRASSSNIWASEPARSVGEFLSIDTVNNMFVTATSSFLAVTASTAAAAGTIVNTPIAVLGQTLASYASSASATSDTRTAITASVKAVVRMM